MLIQILLILFFLLAIIKVIRRYQGGDLTRRAAFIWILFWVLAGVVVALPDSTFYLAHMLGVGRGADAIVYIALAGLFFLVFRLMVRVERLTKDITRFVRHEALAEAEKKITEQK